MTRIRLTSMIAVAAACTALPALTEARAQDAKATSMWVAADRAERRTCSSQKCGVVGNLFYREGTQVFEIKDGWARTTNYYDAGCSNGRIVYVKSGVADCTVANGVTGGRFAEWVRLDLLAQQQPADPAAGAKGTAALIGQSDDFRLHQSAFVKAANQLLSTGDCTENDLKEIGGFSKSTNKGKGIYFIYCGSKRIYLDVATGRTFR